MELVEAKKLREKTVEFLEKAHIIIIPEKKEKIEIADLGLTDKPFKS